MARSVGDRKGEKKSVAVCAAFVCVLYVCLGPLLVINNYAGRRPKLKQT